MMKKNVLITGTSTGVGFETAILLAQKNFKVYATMRNLAKADALKERIAAENLPIEILPLDVTDNASIEKAVNTIIRKDGRIDILINNAGAGFAKTLEQATPAEIDWVTDVNYTGVVRCIKAVLPHMRTARAGHVINITSVGGLVGQPFNELYCGAKFAVEGLTEALATYVGHSFNIKFTNVEPGGISTEFMKTAISKTANEKGEFATGEYAPIFEKYLTSAQERAGGEGSGVYQTGKEVAEVVVAVAENEHPPLRIRTSQWAKDFCALKTDSDPDGTKLVEAVIKYSF